MVSLAQRIQYLLQSSFVKATVESFFSRLTNLLGQLVLDLYAKLTCSLLKIWNWLNFPKVSRHQLQLTNTPVQMKDQHIKTGALTIFNLL